MSPLKATSRWHDYFPLSTDPSRQDAQHQHHKVGEGYRLYLLPSGLPKRYSRVILASLVACGFLYSFHGEYLSGAYLSQQDSTNPSSVPFPEVQQEAPEGGLPPLFEAYKTYEDDVSERILARNNGTGRYIYFANHPTGCGWGNVLQEMVYASLLASEANIGYVYDDFTWDADGRNYSDYNGKLIPARIPLTTMLSGHLLGLSEAEATTTQDAASPPPPPRSISRRVYERTCPQDERVIIKREIAQAYLKKIQSPINLDADTGLDVLHGWLAVLNSPKYKAARCIEVDRGSYHVFDIWLFGSPRLQSLWTRLSLSPTLQYWGWSPLILRAFERNVHLFAPSIHAGGFFSSLFSGSWSSHHPPRAAAHLDTSDKSHLAKKSVVSADEAAKLLADTQPLPILALHVRRGDFVEHCINLAEWGSDYTGMNSFPESRARDAFIVPRVANTPEEHALVEKVSATRHRIMGNETMVASMEDRKRVYAIHCFPEIEQIVRRVREVVHDYVAFAAERERVRNTPWWAWSTVAKDTRQSGVAAAAGAKRSLSLEEEEGEPDLSERTGPTPNELMRKVFIQTNGKKEWLAEVKQALMADAERSKVPVDAGQAPEDGWAFEWHWEDVITSRDLEIGWEEKPVAQALDSYVSQRAEGFIGNGFSSLTSHVVMLRKQKGFDALQTRFW